VKKELRKEIFMRTTSQFFVSVLLSATLGVSASACSSSSPGGDGANPANLCASLCGRVHACDQTQDEETCVNECQDKTSTVVSKLRSDVVTAVDGCVQQEDCATVLSSSFFQTCAGQAIASIAPSSKATKFCSDWASAATTCGESLDQATCLQNVKPYSDDTVGLAEACVSKACPDQTACVAAAFGSTSGG
jgi:hypothetical protein